MQTKTKQTRRLTPTEKRVRVARAALRHLKKSDPKMRKLIEIIGPYRPIISNDPFESLIAAILHQQVSMASARAVQGRLYANFPRNRPKPDLLAALPVEKVREAGVSRQKTGYLYDLADHFSRGTLTARKLRSWDDDRAMTELVKIKGIGRWTAEMLLMFCLERPDVWPIDDLGVQKALMRFHEIEELPPRDELEAIADHWRPYRSYATWYLWRSLEGPLMPGLKL